MQAQEADVPNNRVRSFVRHTTQDVEPLLVRCQRAIFIRAILVLADSLCLTVIDGVLWISRVRRAYLRWCGKKFCNACMHRHFPLLLASVDQRTSVGAPFAHRNAHAIGAGCSRSLLLRFCWLRSP